LNNMLQKKAPVLSAGAFLLLACRVIT